MLDAAGRPSRLRFLRLFDDTVDDPRLAYVARHTRRPVHEVLAVLMTLREAAFALDDDGSIVAWRSEFAAEACEIGEPHVEAIVREMATKQAFIAAGRIVDWPTIATKSTRPTDFCRHFPGLAFDSKWRLIARSAGGTRGMVLAVFVAMLCRASSMEGVSNRGSIAGWSDAVAACALDMPEDMVRRIREAMQGIVLKSDVIAAWGRRQPLREDRTAAQRQRQRRFRMVRSTAASNVTPCHARSRGVTPSHAGEISDGQALRDEAKISTSARRKARAEHRVSYPAQSSNTAQTDEKAYPRQAVSSRTEDVTQSHARPDQTGLESPFSEREGGSGEKASAAPPPLSPMGIHVLRQDRPPVDHGRRSPPERQLPLASPVRTRRTHLPEGWWPSDATIEVGTADCGLPRDAVVGEVLAKFRNHQASQPRTSADWDAEFQRWLRNERPKSRGGGRNAALQHLLDHEASRKDIA